MGVLTFPLMVHFYISQDFGLVYCHRTIGGSGMVAIPKIMTNWQKVEKLRIPDRVYTIGQTSLFCQALRCQKVKYFDVASPTKVFV